MSAPTVVTTSTYGTPTTTNHVVTLPASLVAGNLLLLIYAAGAHVATPSGWTSVAAYSGSGGTPVGVLGKISDGSETTVTLTSGGSNQLAATCHQISGWDGDLSSGITCGTSAAASSASGSAAANPPAVTHSHGAIGTLFVAVCGVNLGNVSITTWPSGYGSTTGSPGKCFTATKSATSDTDDPSAFGWSGVVFTGYTTFAIAIHDGSAVARRRRIYLP